MSPHIPITQGHAVLVDNGDYAWLSQYKWHLAGRRYAAGYVPLTPNSPKQRVYMHRLLLKAQPGQIVDHLDGNPLNNTRENLRLVDRAKNQWNRKQQENASGYKGVSWHRHKQKFYARIQANGTRHFLGYYDSAEEAARVYVAAARQLYGEYARAEVILNAIPPPRTVPEYSGARETPFYTSGVSTP